MRLIKPLLGLALLVGLVSLTNIELLLEQFLGADLLSFACALALAVLANVLCTWRWQRVIKLLGRSSSFKLLLSAYAQGISVNAVLPGGIVGGDAWRSLIVSRLLQAHERQESAGPGPSEGESPHFAPLAVQSVLLDRIAGFWALVCLSLLAGVVALPMAGLAVSANDHWINDSAGRGYLWVLALIFAAPFVGRLVYRRWLHQTAVTQIKSWSESARAVINALPILVASLPVSVIAQVLTVTAFWLCLASVGVAVSWLLLTSLCAGVFLSGILPASIGGFGARELGAVAFITPFGFPTEGVLAGSVLFGLTATIQGFGGLWFWFEGRRGHSP